MLFGGINSNDFLFRALAFLIAITVHEFAHAVVAYRLGDPTPKMQGRITLNPIAHLDILGTLMILFGPLGWAKPVQYVPHNFKGNKRLGVVLTAVAGPVANLITAFVVAIVLALLVKSGVGGEVWTKFFWELLNATVSLNLLLFVFNLVPLPPLDGFWIIRYLLPQRVGSTLDGVEKYGPFVLLLVVVLGWINYVIMPPYTGLIHAISNLLGSF